MMAGNVPIRFSDGKIRMIPAGSVKSVLEDPDFAGAEIVKRPKPSLGSVISGLANKESYASPERMGELGAEGAGALYNLTSASMPAILGTAATLPLGGVGGIAGAAMRTGAGAAGAYGGSMAGDVMQGQAPDLNQAGRNFAFGLGAGVAGEGVAAGGRAAVPSLTKAWVRPTEKMIRESPKLIDDTIALRSRIRKPGEPAVEARNAKRRSMQRTRQMVTGSTASVSVDDALASVLNLRNDVARSAPTDARLPVIDAYIAEVRRKWGAGRIPVSEAHPMKKQAQREGSSKFAKDGEGPATQQELDKLVAQDSRVAIGQQVRGYNRQDNATQRAHAVMKATQRAANLPRPQALPTHAAAMGTGALLGGTHGVAGGIEGAIGGHLFARVLENPWILNRLALMLSSRGGQTAVRNAPRFAAPLAVPPKAE